MTAILRKPLEILDQSARTLRRAVEDLSQHGESNPARWLVDNYSYVRSQIREVQRSLSRGFSRKLDRRARCTGDWRIYRILVEIVSGTNGALSAEILSDLLGPERLDLKLSLAELWAVPPMLKLVLIERLAEAASALNLGSSESESQIQDTLTTLRSLERVDWRKVIESISGVERILRLDPSGTYAAMEFQSRDHYRRVIEEVAYQNNREEEVVARIAIELALQASKESTDPRKFHVGYYLIGPGFAAWLKHCRLPRQMGRGAEQVLNRKGLLAAAYALLTRLRRALLRIPSIAYLGSIALLTCALTAATFHFLDLKSWWWVALLVAPVSQAAVAIANLAAILFFSPRQLPRLDFSNGIPDDCRTFVVVPTLLLSRSGVEKLVERLEIHYLANRDRNLLFALLTDLPDANSATAGGDDLVEFCAERIRRLNARHGTRTRAPFYLFHRAREWNEREDSWMGRERKRGKLEDFNSLLLGLDNRFEFTVGDLNAIGAIRYVITLDSDTQLPRDTAWKLVGNLAHPLNQAVLDPRTKLVREGYAILQPRVSISMESSGKSRLSRVYSGQTGLDPYSTAISDAYQDVFGHATFTGKGIYDLRAFHACQAGRFPANALLSHDLIEGEHASTGLVTDVEVIDDYPTTYEAYAKRKHRWIRGDWQIFYWLLPQVPRADGRWVRNELSVLSRWKIFDNLRRSLLEFGLLLFLLTGWLLMPRSSLWVTIAALSILLLPCYAELAASLVRLPPRRFWRSYLHECSAQFFRSHLEVMLTLAFLLHQALLSLDAVTRTLIRRFVTGKKLLEWESMAQSEENSNAGPALTTRYIIVSSVLSSILGAAFFSIDGLSLVAFLLVVAWALTPLTALFVNTRPQVARRDDPNDTSFLRDVSLQTWRYFLDFSHPDHHWLVPDNVQYTPYAVARRSSPTNFGLQLAANLAAFDFGYLSEGELAMRTGDLLRTLQQMERHRGHFYNWYDTGTLAPLAPRYVSTVDSGNLAAALLTVKQGCQEMTKRPIIEDLTLDGIRDHCLRLRNALPPSVHSLALMRLIAALVRQLEYRPSGLFSWEGVLSEIASMTRALGQHVEWACDQLEARDSNRVQEIRYWHRALDERVRAALHSLCSLAPWLSSPFELELRALANDGSFEDLMNALSAVPSLGGLPHTYDSIQGAIGRLLESPASPRPSLRELLERLVDEIDSTRSRAQSLLDAFARCSRTASRLAREMDFEFLIDKSADLLHIGYRVETREMDSAYYDLLASEARTAVFFAIAKGDAPRDAWFRLGRRITSFRGQNVLLSSSGTLFEYLMPVLFMKAFDPTLLGECLRGVVRIQQLYARQCGVPWGISEAAHSERDHAGNYQYQAFGVPFISQKGTPSDDLVVAPYATMLALMVDRSAATANLKEMAGRGWIGRYGFFESVDCRRGRFSVHNRARIVRAFMAHHQAMGLLSICNAVCDSPMQRRFHADAMVAATELLLQERVPALLAAEEEERTAVIPQPPLTPAEVDAA